MDLVELTPLRDALVGLPGVNGLSTEQRKRLTIAVELVANRSIIFMDKPRSRLDARATAIVMRTIRNTVGTWRIVVCTIHQPSIDVFEAFDEGAMNQMGLPMQQGHFMGMNPMHSGPGGAPPCIMVNMQGPSSASGTRCIQLVAPLTVLKGGYRGFY